MEMALRPKWKPLLPPKVETKTKSLKTKKVVLKSIHNYKKKKSMYPPSNTQNTMAVRQLKYPWKSTPRRNKFDYYAIIKFPLITESAMKKTEDNNRLVFIVNVKANKHQIQQAVKKPYDTDVAKVNTQIRTD
ncbi:60S ribosomal protein L23a-like [Suncus etruscus]|uniref:60S ribosomal protein L23a-like n=1 Tax=Suncus etruscus TaxID=109475 RepID=UPI00210F3970|nr:60S ribosomal protein L23a-like [Suncus etruscus]